MLKEFGGGVDVEEDAVVEALHLAGVAGPNLEAEVVQLTLFICIEEFGKAADLLVFLIVESSLDDLVHEVKDRQTVLFEELTLLLFKREVLIVADDYFASATLGTSLESDHIPRKSLEGKCTYSTNVVEKR